MKLPGSHKSPNNGNRKWFVLEPDPTKFCFIKNKLLYIHTQNSSFKE